MAVFINIATPQVAFAETENATAVSDPATINEWFNDIADSTENVGRIWTDKSVYTGDSPALDQLNGERIAKGSSDFLVSLSSISSTSNIASTVTKPLDIVLVLDTSGSMGQSLGISEVYAVDLNTDRQYRYYPNGLEEDYRTLRHDDNGWYYGRRNNKTYVTPKTSATDTDATHVQFYLQQTKLDALKTAVNGFIDKTVEMNDGILDPAQQHRISLVAYASSATTRSNFTAYDTNNATASPTADALKRTINGLSASGSTAADYAMNETASQINNNGRTEAQKVVIFFTDGEPNHQSGFDASVANDAIEAAGALKSSKTDPALVYSIGLFGAANPDDTQGQFNAYMNGMSSNYPDATSYTQLGTRAPSDKHYYYAPKDAAQLSKVFDDISSEISASTGYPTQTTEGNVGTSGYITYTDQLGDYMQVDDMKCIVVRDKKVPYTSKSVDDSNPAYSVTSYVFEAEVPGLYEGANLHDIKLTVTHYADARRGDLVQIQQPAGLISLVNYQVEDATGENPVLTSDKDQIHPGNIFYGVSLKPEAKALLALPDADMADYLASHTTTNVDGTQSVTFLSNAYTGGVWEGTPGVTYGDTTASFEPAASNCFYYATEDTLLFTDKELTQPATGEPDPSATYYCKHTYFENDANGATARVESAVEFKGNSLAVLEDYVHHVGGSSNGQLYLAKGAPRLTRLNDFDVVKSENTTDTADSRIDPVWSDVAAGAALRTMNVHLGNNGRLNVGLPGTLAVTKELRDVPAGVNVADYEDVAFKMDITVEGAANKTCQAQVFNANGQPVGDSFDVTFDAQGKRSQSIKNGETLRIYGLDSVAYAVSEDTAALPAGFKLVEGSCTGLTGSIAAGEESEALVVNTYAFDTPVTWPATDFQLEKTLEGRAARATDTFYVAVGGFGEYPNGGKVDQVPMPEEGENWQLSKEDPEVAYATIKMDESTTDPTSKLLDFAQISFANPGTYTYDLYEVHGENSTIAGINYDSATYRVTIEVVDQGDGTLAIADGGITITETVNGVTETLPADTKTLEFVNMYSAAEAVVPLNGVKLLTGKPLEAGMFGFKITEVADDDGSGAPLQWTEANNPGSVPVDIMPADVGIGQVKTNGAGADFGVVDFGSITYDEDDIDHTYTYKIVETETNIPGVTNDPTYRVLTVEVTEETEGGNAIVKATPKMDVYDASGNWLRGDAITPSFSFTNAYQAANAEVKIQGEKTLEGRDWKSSDSFAFALTAADRTTQDAIDAGKIVLAQGGDTATAVAGEAAGKTRPFEFGSLTFTPASVLSGGSYWFAVKEVVPENTQGIAYDTGTCLVNVVVKDDGKGQIVATVTYANQNGGSTEKAQFTNTYGASVSYGDAGPLVVSKTLIGRTMKSGEFAFAISGADDASAAKLADADKSFANTQQRASGVAELMNKLAGVAFTQDDAGKTFAYTVAETAGALGGVTYDKSVYEVAITPVDNGDGTMYTVTRVTKATAADGTTIPEAERQSATYDSSQGQRNPTVAFDNKYAYKPVTLDATAQGLFHKVLQGRDWLATDEFTFGLAATNAENPKPESLSATVTAPAGTKSGTAVDFGFGAITFDVPGTYVYHVTEQAGSIPGISYSANIATLTVTVADNGEGQLTASPTVANATFYNTYSSTLPYTAMGGLNLTKVTNGHSMDAGQFAFHVQPADEASADKFQVAPEGFSLSSPAANNGQRVWAPVFTEGVAFTQDDAGKVYSFTIAEDQTAQAGYTLDTTTYTVTIEAADDPATGALTVTTTVSGGADGSQVYTYKTGEEVAEAAHVDFVNSYSASTEGGTAAKVETIKTLTGRDQAEGEFRFAISPLVDDEVVAETTATATTDAAGKVSFPAVNYTAAELDAAVEAGRATKSGDVWTLTYRAYEITGELGGVTAQQSSFDFTVRVTDDGAGTLTSEVLLPEGHGFANSYSAESTALELNGSKIAASAQGITPPSIAGKFTFELSAGEGVPLPATTSATCDEHGNVSFGEVTYTQDVFDSAAGVAGTDAQGNRTKTFTYAVSESGQVPGFTNDAQATRTFTVTVHDDGEGRLFATTSATDVSADLFQFTNTYSVEPETSSVTDQVQVTKTLAGRDLVEGEFTFELLEGEEVVATGVNSADGTVTLSSIEYTEPGTHTYMVREQAGTAGGVSYDPTVYTVITVVADNGDGTLAVTHTLGGDAPAAGVAFANTYTAQPTSVSLSATKALTGRELKDGEFAFELKDAEGKVLQTKHNNAAGAVVFDPITYDVPGTHAYTVSEVAGTDAEVAYDSHVATITVTVTDTGTGSLSAAVEGKAEFQNAYNAPEPAPTPEKPGSGNAVTTLAETGDSAMAVGVAALVLAVGICAMGLVLRVCRKR